MTDYAISRDSRRVPLETRVSLRFERFSGFISEFSSNISPGGMFVKTQAPSPVGTLLDFEFQLGDGYPLIKGTGEVTWLRSDEQGPDKPAGMGLRFLRLSKGSRELIYKIVDEFIHQGGEPFDLEAGAAGRPPVPAGQAAAESAPAEGSGVEAPAPPQPVAATPALAPAAVPVPFDAPAAARMPLAPTAEAAAPPSEPPLAALSLPALAARTFGGAAEGPSPVPPAPLPEPPVPLGAYAAAAAQPRANWTRGRLAAVVAAAVLVGLGAAAFVFQEPLMRRAGLLGRGEGGAPVSPDAAPATADATPPGGGATAPAAGAEAPSLAPSGGRDAVPAAASTDAIPEPAPPSAAAGPENLAAPAGQARDPAPPPPAPSRPQPAPAAPAASAPLTAIRSITWRLAGEDTELTVRGDGPIRAGGYTRARLEGGSPRELIRIRGVRGPYSPARLAVGSSQLKQVRTGHHVLPGGQELHLVLDLADSGVVVRSVEEVDGALVVRLGRR